MVKVDAPAERDPSEVPPLTVSPVVVALPKLVFPVTPREPNSPPPVTLNAEVVAFVDQKFVAVRFVDEAFNIVVVEAMSKLPVKNPLPTTDKRCPGLVVPMPTLPEFRIRILSTTAEPCVVPGFVENIKSPENDGIPVSFAIREYTCCGPLLAVKSNLTCCPPAL